MKINSQRTLKSRIKQGIATSLVGLAALFSGCGSNNKLIDTETLKHLHVETAFVSDQVIMHGGAVRGNVRQDTFLFNLNNRLSGYVWQNYSFKEKAFNERDLRIWYTHPISKSFSVNAGYHYFDYPTGTFGDYDSALVAGANYKGPINLDFDLTQLIPNKNTDSGTRIYAKASKKIPLFKKEGLEIALTPSVSTAYIDRFFNISGLSQITPGINLGINKGNLNINFFLNNQKGLISEIPSLTWAGLSAGYKF